MARPSARLGAIAWRNLWRNRRRTFITLFGTAFGILLAILFTGLGDASYSGMIDTAARMGSGHVSIQHPEYQELPSLKKSIRQVETLEQMASDVGRVERVTTRISGAAMLSTAANSQGAFFIGIDPAREDLETFAILEAVDEGEMFTEREGRGIVLGATLAENLDTRLGRKVVYTLTDKHGEIVSGLGRVKGIMHSGSPSVDGGLALLPIDTVRELLGYEPDEATHVAVFLDDNRASAGVAQKLDAVLPEQTDAATWVETQPDLSGFIDTKRTGTLVFEAIILLLLAAGIFNTLFVSVMERLREFGIMMAVGFSPAQLFTLVMWESVWLAVMGIVAGAVVSAWPYYYLNTTGVPYDKIVGEGVEVAGVGVDPVIYVEIYPEKLLVIGVVVVVATLAAGLYPAWKAGRVDPVETIKLV